MKEAVFLDQSAKALRLTLLQDLDISQFSVLVQETQTFGAIQVEAAIIGASHYIGYSFGNIRFWEVFACTPIQGEALTVCDLVNSPQNQLQLAFGDYCYGFEQEHFTWQDGYQRAEEIKNTTNITALAQIKLAYTFPRGPLQQTPCTAIKVQGHTDFLWVETVHSYPNEAQIVFTKSQLSLRGQS